MFEIMSAEQMKKADLQAIAEGQPAIELIDKAALGMAEIIRDKFDKQAILILNGPGNNGADGWIAAKYLKDWGWPVRVACTHTRDQLKNDAKEAVARWDGPIEPLAPDISLKGSALIVDCLYGTGYSGTLPPAIIKLFDNIRAAQMTVVAADVPSGMNATTGTSSSGTLKADLTIAFCRKKIAHVTAPGKDTCGEIAVAPVHIPQEVIAAQRPNVFENDPSLWAAALPKIPGDKTPVFNSASTKIVMLVEINVTLAEVLKTAAEKNTVVIAPFAGGIVASPDGTAVIHTQAAIQEGTEKKLLSHITGLIEQGVPAYQAAQAGFWQHTSTITPTPRQEFSRLL